MTRPKIEVEKSQLDKSLDVITMAAMGAYLVYIFVSYANLPAQIPSHFGPTGAPDAWSSKNTIFILPAVGLFTYALLKVISRYPHTFNFPVKITPENAASQYQKAISLLTRLNAAIVFTFIYISWRTIAIAKGTASGLGNWFLAIMLLLVFLPIIFYFIETTKGKKS